MIGMIYYITSHNYFLCVTNLITSCLITLYEKCVRLIFISYTKYVWLSNIFKKIKRKYVYSLNKANFHFILSKDINYHLPILNKW